MGKIKTSEDRTNDLNEVDTLMELFMKKAEEYFKSREAKREYPHPCVEWASVKRISLELTRALAKLRKNEK